MKVSKVLDDRLSFPRPPSLPTLLLPFPGPPFDAAVSRYTEAVQEGHNPGQHGQPRHYPGQP